MAVLDRSDGAIGLVATGAVPANFVLGTALPHPYPLHIGNHSVHSSAEALRQGEAHIEQLRVRLIARERERRARADGSVPVMR